jgi:manganese oxidase
MTRLPRRALDRPGQLALALTAAGVGWQQFLHSRMGATEAAEPGLLAHWARDAALALPAVLLAVVVGLLVADRLLRARPAADATARRALLAAAAAVAAAAALALGGPVHEALFAPAAHVHGLPVALHVLRDGLLSLPVTLLVANAVLALRPVEHWRLVKDWRRPTARVAAFMLVVSPLALLTPASPATADTGPCPAGSRPITYDLAAFQNVIPLNGWGDKIKDGLQYALKNDDARKGKKHIVDNPSLSQPIVVRANVNDCITVKLRNDIRDRRIGLHPDGLVQFDPKTSDGARVGNNPDTTVATGQDITYTWYADRVGEAPLVDVGNLDSSGPHEPTMQLGLYGGVVVHPKGSTWHDPRTGANLLNGAGVAVQTEVFADVHVSGGKDFRSFAMIIMDENEDITDRNDKHPTFPTTGLPDSTFGVNYRAEPLRNRLRAILEHRAGKTITLPNGTTYTKDDHFCDGYVPELDRVVVEDPGAKCMGEESHLQAWIFGDEGKLTRATADGIVTDSDNLIPKAYKGDRTRFHVIHPGAHETHPWHQHTQRWLADPDHPQAHRTPRKDVQNIGPGEAYPLELEGGAGGPQGTIGDSIFHCHFYPHFAGGFWGHLRIFDRLRDGTQDYPDGTPLEELKQLPDRAGATPAPDELHPGFPLFVKGDVGQRAYRAPHTVVKDDFKDLRRPGDTVREPSDLEKANMPALDKSKPGAGYIDPCPDGAPARTYTPHTTDGKIVYNSAGWHDKQGRVYAKDQAEAKAIRDGTKNPEPYTIRARMGECVTILHRNETHLDDDPSVPLDHVNKLDGEFMHKTETSEISTHVHLVKFDQLASDGTSVGWNYVQAAMPGQTHAARWFVDTALRTVFFHDHQYANLHQQKGLFAAMNVEPPGATWHDPRTGRETDGVGPMADIRPPGGPAFREMTVFHQDRIPLWKGDGKAAIQPPPAVDDYGADQGGYALNYRNEPFQIRTAPGAQGLKGDPAYVYSSVVHGDPLTPLLRAYPRDPVIIRNVAGSHEEVHTFNLHGHRWLSEPDNPDSALVDNQTIALAEYFNYEIGASGRPSRMPTLPTAQLAGMARAGIENGVPAILDGGAGKPGDYLYGSTPLDDQWLGMWGIFRVPAARVSDLAPLPQQPPPASSGSEWPAVKRGERYPAVPPPPSTRPSELDCPVDSPKRPYDISAIQTKIVYNAKTGDHDPHGLMFALTEDVKAIRDGSKPAEPLVIRAHAGDCVNITLRNTLPSTGLPAHDGDVPLPADAAFPKGARVSLHPSLVNYDVHRADGAAVGFNHDSTVAPGRLATFSWHVPDKLDGATINLVDFGDRRGHRHHGLFGALLVEPKGSTWTDPATGAPVRSGAVADIRWSGGAYREHALNWQDGLNLRTPAGQAIPDASKVKDPYDKGNRGVNYRTERFAPRLAHNAQPAWVFSSQVHGDPATPLVQAHAGDPLRIRLLQGSDRGRAHSVVFSGHSWPYQPGDPTSRPISTSGILLTGEARTLPMTAGGLHRHSGDYLYRDGSLTNQVNAGLWGLIRIHGAGSTSLLPLS